MNNWQNEFMAEYHRQEILEQVEQIHLESIARKCFEDCPRLIARTMFRLSNWMISEGRQLRKRYEVPASNCTSSSKTVLQAK